MISKKRTILAFLLMWYVYALYISVPSIVFYFDQEESVASSLVLSGNRVQFWYYNEGKAAEYQIEKKVKYTKNREMLKGVNEWPILYSKTFPSKVILVRTEPKPGLLPPLLILGISSIPLMFFKNLKFN